MKTMPCQRCGAPESLTVEEYVQSVPCKACVARAEGKLPPLVEAPPVVDPSILGFTVVELSDMDEEERKAKLVELLNQAADLAEALADVFAKDLGSTKERVKLAAKALMTTARSI